jgi:hypothetical protein
MVTTTTSASGTGWIPHSSSFGSAGPGALAHLTGDPLGIMRLAAQQLGDRGLDLLGVGGAVIAQQGGGVGALQQVGGVGQAAVGDHLGPQQPGHQPGVAALQLLGPLAPVGVLLAELLDLLTREHAGSTLRA